MEFDLSSFSPILSNKSKTNKNLNQEDILRYLDQLEEKIIATELKQVGWSEF